jgi:hypothetical protein
MTEAQFLSLVLRLMIGTCSWLTMTVDWGHMSRRKQFFIAAWLVFWLGPPLYFIWTKGVLG